MESEDATDGVHLLLDGASVESGSVAPLWTWLIQYKWMMDLEGSVKVYGSR